MIAKYFHWAWKGMEKAHILSYSLPIMTFTLNDDLFIQLLEYTLRISHKIPRKDHQTVYSFDFIRMLNQILSSFNFFFFSFN